MQIVTVHSQMTLIHAVSSAFLHSPTPFTLLIDLLFGPTPAHAENQIPDLSFNSRRHKVTIAGIFFLWHVGRDRCFPLSINEIGWVTEKENASYFPATINSMLKARGIDGIFSRLPVLSMVTVLYLLLSSISLSVYGFPAISLSSASYSLTPFFLHVSV